MSYKEEIKEYIKTEARQETRKLREMSWSDRFWYIWEYYKWHMLICVMIAMFVMVIATSIYNSTLKTRLYCVAINNPAGQQLDSSVLTEDFAEYMQFGKKDQIFAESMYLPSDGTFDDMAMANQTKLAALMAARSLDVMISDEVFFQKYAQISSFLDLETVLPEDVLDLVRDRLIYAKDESGQELPLGIDVTGNWLLEEMGVSTSPACFSIMVNSENIDNCAALLRFMYQRQPSA